MDHYVSTLNTVGETILSWADPETKYRGHTEGWPLTDFPTAFTIAAAYMAFVVIGSAIMKLDAVPAIDPYPLKFVYNVSQIMLCSYMTIEAFLLAYRNNYTVIPCVGYNQTNPPLANLLWLSYVSKVWDFWDTAFIVFGKKWKQLSFLHVYHHTTVFLLYWLNSNVVYDGDVYLTILLNGFIHTVMYTYYFICMHTKIPDDCNKNGTVKSSSSLRIWWKPYLTIMQMIQFVTLMVQGTYLLCTDCQTRSLKVMTIYVIYLLTLLLLFAHFFVQSYMKKPTTTKKSKLI